MEFSHERGSGTEFAVRWEAVLVPDSQNIIENKIACEGCYSMDWNQVVDVI